MSSPVQLLEPELKTPGLSLRQLLIEPSESTGVQLFRYLFVGGLAFVLDFGALYVLTSRAGLHYLTSAAIAFLLGLIANYLLSRAWVFPRRKMRNTGIEFAVFAGIGLIGLGLNELGMWLLSGIAGLHYLIAKMCTTAVVFFWNFAARKLSLFR